jgi:peptidoglycan/LPS O-acetylase OafA/YrhL
MVLLFHAKLIIWGWMGVYLFFVLSGFLITRNLLESKGKPGYYKSFFVKRTPGFSRFIT